MFLPVMGPVFKLQNRLSDDFFSSDYWFYLNFQLTRSKCNDVPPKLKSKMFSRQCLMTGMNVIELLVDDNVDFPV